jgi:hypothetical protein
MMFNMSTSAKGDISKQFMASDKMVKQQVMDQVVAESSSRVSITREQAASLLSYEEGVACKVK